MTVNNGALNRADFDTVTYYHTRLLIPRDKNLLYCTRLKAISVLRRTDTLTVLLEYIKLFQPKLQWQIFGRSCLSLALRYLKANYK